jgi:FAD/FMN-containing dehydrogenase
VTNVGSAVEEGPAVMRAAYGANYARLVALKHQYDPTNFFRYNQNITPAEVAVAT